MQQNTIKSTDSSSAVVYGCLEEMVRLQAQALIQRVLEEEVEALLGRKKYERKAEIAAPVGYRNGYGKERKLALTSGTVMIRRPRVKGLEEHFESRILPLFVRRSAEVGELIPELYLHGLSHGDFELALRGLLGDGAPLSPSSVARLKEKWQADKAAWDQRSLADLDVVYLWVDGVYIKAGLEKEKACVFVAVAGLADGRKVIVSLDLKARGMRSPRLVSGDGNLGIWGAVTSVFPEADDQRCWNHRIVNVLDKLPKKLQEAGKKLLKLIPYADTKIEAEVAKKRFQSWATLKGQKEAASLIDVDWDRMVTFYRYPKEHWRHLRTSNIGSPQKTEIKAR